MTVSLLDPIQIKTMNLSNRLVLPPLSTEIASPEGYVSPKMLEHYKKKSAGGYIGLIIIEHSFVSPGGKAHERQLSVADDSVIEGLRKLATVIHDQGSRAVLQISHVGSATKADLIGATPVAPSAVDNPLPVEESGECSSPRELYKYEIAGVVQDFIRAAGRARAAGCDGVEIHSAHGYLLNEFFSPLTNKRDDDYGGAVTARIRIHLEIIRGIRDALGPDYPIFLRLGAADYREGGTTIADSIVAAKAFEAAGLDALDVSGGFCGFNALDGTARQGYFAPLSEALKQAISIPVLVTGGIKDALVADQLLQDGKADLIGVGRPMLADSLWAKNAIETLRGLRQ